MIYPKAALNQVPKVDSTHSIPQAPVRTSPLHPPFHIITTTAPILPFISKMTRTRPSCWFEPKEGPDSLFGPYRIYNYLRFIIYMGGMSK